MVASRIDEILAYLEDSSKQDILELRITPPSMEKHGAWMNISSQTSLPLTEEEAFGAAEEALLRDLWLDEFQTSRHWGLYYRNISQTNSERRSAGPANRWRELAHQRLPLGRQFESLIRRYGLSTIDQDSFLLSVARGLAADRPSLASDHLLGMAIAANGQWRQAAQVYKNMARRAKSTKAYQRALSNLSACLSNAGEDRNALASANRLVRESDEPWVWLNLLVSATRSGDKGMVAAASYNLEQRYAVDSLEVQQSRARRRLRVKAGLQQALPKADKDGVKWSCHLGEVSQCLLEA